MSDEQYWIPFKIQEQGCSLVACGPFASHEEAMAKREAMKVTAALNEYIGIPFVAKTKEEAEKRAHLF